MNSEIKNLPFSVILQSVKDAHQILSLSEAIITGTYGYEDQSKAATFQKNLIDIDFRLITKEEERKKLEGRIDWMRQHGSEFYWPTLEEREESLKIIKMQQKSLEERLIECWKEFDKYNENWTKIYKVLVEELIWRSAKYKFYRDVPWY